MGGGRAYNERMKAAQASHLAVVETHSYGRRLTHSIGTLWSLRTLAHYRSPISEWDRPYQTTRWNSCVAR